MRRQKTQLGHDFNRRHFDYHIPQYTWYLCRSAGPGHPHQGHGGDLEHHPMVRGEEAETKRKQCCCENSFPKGRMEIIIVVCSVWKGFIPNPSNGNRVFRYQSLNTFFFLINGMVTLRYRKLTDCTYLGCIFIAGCLAWVFAFRFVQGSLTSGPSSFAK